MTTGMEQCAVTPQALAAERDFMVRVAQRYTHDQAEAEDAAHRVLLNLLRRLRRGTLDTRSSLRSYLAVAVRNEALRLRRRHSRLRLAGDDLPVLPALGWQIESVSAQRIVDTIDECLTPSEVSTMRATLDGVDDAEFARRKGVTKGTVQKTRQRARRRIERALLGSEAPRSPRGPRPSALAELLRTARSARGLSQPQLARLLGVHCRTIQKWESGDATPRPERMLCVLSVLNVDPEHPAVRGAQGATTSSDPAAFASLLRSRRDALGWSVATVSRAVGVHWRSIDRWESGALRVSAKHLTRLIAVLGLDPDHPIVAAELERVGAQ